MLFQMTSFYPRFHEQFSADRLPVLILVHHLYGSLDSSAIWFCLIVTTDQTWFFWHESELVIIFSHHFDFVPIIYLWRISGRIFNSARSLSNIIFGNECLLWETLMFIILQLTIVATLMLCVNLVVHLYSDRIWFSILIFLDQLAIIRSRAIPEAKLIDSIIIDNSWKDVVIFHHQFKLILSVSYQFFRILNLLWSFCSYCHIFSPLSIFGISYYQVGSSSVFSLF